MRRNRVLAVVLALVGGTLIVPAGPVVAEPEPSLEATCPDALPVDEVTPGMTGTGLTTSRGTVPEPFDVEVIDVLENGIAPGIPLIVVETSSTEIDRVGGIWYGMSGSPVYVDGKLLGAIAYGFSWAPSKLAGVTPAAAMLQVGDRTQGPAADGEIAMSEPVRRQARAEGMSASQASSMRQLRVPVRATGPQGAKFDRFAAAFERAYPGTAVVRGTGTAGTSSSAAEIVPGGNLAVSLSYGDFSAIGVGTATTVCDGVVTGFGHPMMFDGATTLGMHAASAVRIADDQTLGPYKLANAGPPVGTIDQDRLAAVGGRVGVLPPTTAITSTITNLDDGRTVTGRTDAVWPESIFFFLILHGWINFDSLVFDDISFAGTSEVAWTIEGLRADGTPWSVTRENRHASRWDLSSASLFEAAASAERVLGNEFEEVRLTGIDYHASGGGPYSALSVLGRQVTAAVGDGPFVEAHRGVELVPGVPLHVRVPLRRYRGEVQTVEVTLDVPEDAVGFGEVSIGTADDYDDWGDCDFFDDCSDDVVESFEELLEDIATQPRSDDLTVTLALFPHDDWYDTEGPPPTDHDREDVSRVSTTVRVPEVVTGFASFPVDAPFPSDCPVPVDAEFWDVDPDSAHGWSVACAASLGLMKGVSSDPPLFDPAGAIRRDQAATVVARVLALGPKPLPVGNQRFTDLAGNGHRQAIEQLAAAGIVRGRTATTYAPRRQVTRAQLATLLVEALRWATEEPLVAGGGPYFHDVAGPHAANIDAGFELGLLQGRSDGSFRPGKPTRRDQMATLLLRFHRTLLAG